MGVKVTDTGYCIRTTDQYAEGARPQCYSGNEYPGGSRSLIGS